MKIEYGDIWKVAERFNNPWICIPTNEGWAKNGRNVMGRGLAKEALEKYPSLAKIYGELLRLGYRGVMLQAPLILVPVKPCISYAPQLSWRQPASIGLIKQSLFQLKEMNKNIYGEILITPLGCGNGGLDQKVVLPIMEIYLTEDNFILVLKEKGE